MSEGYWHEGDDPYCYPETTVLINKPGITEAKALETFEKNIAEANIVEVRSFLKKAIIDFSLWKKIHKTLFLDVYEWAGRIRTVQMAKGKSLFAYPEHIEGQAEVLFRDLKDDDFLKNLKHEGFCKKFTYYYCELNALHPFREGNGRTQKILVDELARRAGYKVHWKDISVDRYIESVEKGYYGDYVALEALFDKAIESTGELTRTP